MSHPAQRILITGAGSGLGRALALHYARRGAQVAVVDIDLARAGAVAQEVQALGAQAIHLQCDVGSDASVVALQKAVQQAWGGVDVLINNAGVAGSGTVHETSMDDWHTVVNIDLMGVVRGCHAFIPGLMAQKKGHVVNIASFAAIALMPGMANYNVAKIGVLGLSESLRGELEDHGVGVTVVCPSFFQTNLMQNTFGPVDMKPFVDKLMKKSPINADDIAAMIAQAVDKNQFLLLPHKDTRTFWRLKRFFPNWWHGKVMQGRKKMLAAAKKF